MQTDTRTLRIGQAARAAGLHPRTLRYYEEIGLVRPAGRTPTGYRLYTSREVDALRFVHRARALDLSLPEIRDLLRTWTRGERPCGDLDKILRRRLGEIETRIQELERLREEMRQILQTPFRATLPEGVCPKLSHGRVVEHPSGRRRRRVPTTG